MEQPDVEAEEVLPPAELVKEEPEFLAEDHYGTPLVWVKRPFTPGEVRGSERNWIVKVDPEGSLVVATVYDWVGEETTIDLHPTDNRIRVFNPEGRELQ